MKVLVVGHAYCAKINRDKWKVLAQQHPDIKLKVIFPAVWPDVLFTLQTKDVSSEQLENCEFVPLDAFYAGNEMLYGYYPRALRSLLISFQPDLIHVEQGDDALSYVQVILFAKKWCPHAKFTFFTWINWERTRSWKYNLLWKPIERINLAGTNGAFVGNNDAQLVLRKKGFSKPVQVLPQLGVDMNFFYPAQSVEKSNYTITCIGRLVEGKGVFVLADAFISLVSSFPEWKLLFVGDGKAAKRLSDYVTLKGMEKQIEVKPPVSHEKVRDVLWQTDILVLPSYDVPTWREQFGHILIEAMACKIPVIGSDGGEIPHVIGGAGLVCKQKDVSSLADCLSRLMSDKRYRQEIAQKGYERTKIYYSHEAIARKIYEFWQMIVN